MKEQALRCNAEDNKKEAAPEFCPLSRRWSFGQAAEGEAQIRVGHFFLCFRRALAAAAAKMHWCLASQSPIPHLQKKIHACLGPVARLHTPVHAGVGKHETKLTCQVMRQGLTLHRVDLSVLHDILFHGSLVFRPVRSGLPSARVLMLNTTLHTCHHTTLHTTLHYTSLHFIILHYH